MGFERFIQKLIYAESIYGLKGDFGIFVDLLDKDQLQRKCFCGNVLAFHFNLYLFNI